MSYMGKFKEEFKLIQDTPMWVFNPDDPGCGLRATEVKPKLDRYLREKCDGVTKATNPDWFIGDTDALDYKMRIECSGKEEIKFEESYTNKKGKPATRNLYPLFFANMDSKKETNEAKTPKRLLMFKDITVYIFTKHEALLTKIKETLPKFFACHSFGTRQSKGFGCFRVISDNKQTPNLNGAINEIENTKNQQGSIIIPEGNCFYFTVKDINIKDEDKKLPNLFSHIHYFHKVIRSGLNENNNYVKSLMFYYAKSKGQYWDKPVIRRKFEYFNDVYKYITNGEKMLPRNENSANYIRKKYVDRSGNREIKGEYDMETPSSVILYRDCLGLATEQAWMSYDNRGEKEKITISSDTVTRFTSPVKYHPLKCKDGYIVFIILDAIDPNYRTAKFEVLNAIRNNAVRYTDKTTRISPIKGKVPNNEQFDLVDYFDFIIKNTEKATPNTLNEGSRQYSFIKNAFSTLTKVK